MTLYRCRHCDARYISISDEGTARCLACDGWLSRVWMPEFPRAESGTYRPGPNTYASLDDFATADPGRLTSPELDFGLRWREGSDANRSYRAAWVEETGELYVVQAGSPSAGGGHVEVLGVTDRDGVESALEGWQTRCGEEGSLTWIRARARALPRKPRRAMRRAVAVALGATVIALGVPVVGQQSQATPLRAADEAGPQAEG